MNVVLDIETRAGEADDHKQELRLWLRLLTCSTMIEREIRRRLRARFDVTLPRFDLLAQLDKAPDGMTLGQLSQRMMVSNGNVTGLVKLLVTQGMVESFSDPADRRTTYVRLTQNGRRSFAEIATAHADWIAELVAGLDAVDMRRLMDGLGRLKSSVRNRSVEYD